MNILQRMLDEAERKKEEEERKKREMEVMGVSGKPVSNPQATPIKKPIQSIGVRG